MSEAAATMPSSPEPSRGFNNLREVGQNVATRVKETASNIYSKTAEVGTNVKEFFGKGYAEFLDAYNKEGLNYEGRFKGFWKPYGSIKKWCAHADFQIVRIVDNLPYFKNRGLSLRGANGFSLARLESKEDAWKFAKRGFMFGTALSANGILGPLGMMGVYSVYNSARLVTGLIKNPKAEIEKLKKLKSWPGAAGFLVSALFPTAGIALGTYTGAVSESALRNYKDKLSAERLEAYKNIEAFSTGTAVASAARLLIASPQIFASAPEAFATAGESVNNVYEYLTNNAQLGEAYGGTAQQNAIMQASIVEGMRQQEIIEQQYRQALHFGEVIVEEVKKAALQAEIENKVANKPYELNKHIIAVDDKGSSPFDGVSHSGQDVVVEGQRFTVVQIEETANTDQNDLERLINRDISHGLPVDKAILETEYVTDPGTGEEKAVGTRIIYLTDIDDSISQLDNVTIGQSNSEIVQPSELYKEVVVERGDTLANIAYANKIPLQDLLSVNPQFTAEYGRDPDLIFQGDVVKVPNPVYIDIVSELSEVAVTVQKGDTLANIAYANGMTANELLDANPQFTEAYGRNPNLIFPGETVFIPLETTQYSVHSSQSEELATRQLVNPTIISSFEDYETNRESIETIEEVITRIESELQAQEARATLQSLREMALAESEESIQYSVESTQSTEEVTRDMQPVNMPLTIPVNINLLQELQVLTEQEVERATRALAELELTTPIQAGPNFEVSEQQSEADVEQLPVFNITIPEINLPESNPENNPLIPDFIENSFRTPLVVTPIEVPDQVEVSLPPFTEINLENSEGTTPIAEETASEVVAEAIREQRALENLAEQNRETTEEERKGIIEQLRDLRLPTVDLEAAGKAIEDFGTTISERFASIVAIVWPARVEVTPASEVERAQETPAIITKSDTATNEQPIQEEQSTQPEVAPTPVPGLAPTDVVLENGVYRIATTVAGWEVARDSYETPVLKEEIIPTELRPFIKTNAEYLSNVSQNGQDESCFIYAFRNALAFVSDTKYEVDPVLLGQQMAKGFPAEYDIKNYIPDNPGIEYGNPDKVDSIPDLNKFNQYIFEYYYQNPQVESGLDEYGYQPDKVKFENFEDKAALRNEVLEVVTENLDTGNASLLEFTIRESNGNDITHFFNVVGIRPADPANGRPYPELLVQEGNNWAVRNLTLKDGTQINALEAVSRYGNMSLTGYGQSLVGITLDERNMAALKRDVYVLEKK